MMILKIEWIQQGNIEWEDWYTEENGRHLKKSPKRDEHISFANYDLKNKNLPCIKVAKDDSLYIELIYWQYYFLVRDILAYHGFEITEPNK